MLARPPIAEITRTIVERFQPQRVVVFGSYARGDAGEDSDLDLFVELDTPLRPMQRAIQIASVFGIRPWAMDLIVYTPAEVMRERERFGSLMSTIEREGRTLYDRERTIGMDLTIRLDLPLPHDEAKERGLRVDIARMVVECPRSFAHCTDELAEIVRTVYANSPHLIAVIINPFEGLPQNLGVLLDVVEDAHFIRLAEAGIVQEVMAVPAESVTFFPWGMADLSQVKVQLLHKQNVYWSSAIGRHGLRFPEPLANMPDLVELIVDYADTHRSLEFLGTSVATRKAFMLVTSSLENGDETMQPT